MRAWVLALALGGCGFSSSGLPGHGSDAGDPPVDGPAGGEDGGAGVVRVCLGTFVNVCVDSPRAALDLMTQTIDTSTSPLCRPYIATPSVDACVIASQSIAIRSGNTVSVTGARRLVLLADDSLTITGTLDAASHRRELSGPAADTGPCPGPSEVTDPTFSGQGGGAWGGTFGLPGSNGGNTPGGGIGGIAGSALQITALGGGCRGGKGGGDNGGGGGHGGGAVLLLAGQAITIDGTVNASGAGGSGGSSQGGGGGGGTGGMIVLEAPTVTIPGRCFANGGGGGEGSSDLLNGNGGGESSAPDRAGGGGNNGSTVGGNGGDGGFGSTASKPGGNGTHTSDLGGHDGGGGGGGGAAGIIKILSEDQGNTDDPAKVSPPPT